MRRRCRSASGRHSLNSGHCTRSFTSPTAMARSRRDRSGTAVADWPAHSEPASRATAIGRSSLVKAGKAVLLPDSYGSRELGPQCRVKERSVLARRETGCDVMASRQWLMQKPWTARDRISLMGWANGASALLWAVRPQLPSRKCRAGFPLGDRVLSGLPPLVGAWMERPRSDAAVDRRQGRRQFAARLPSDDRWRARAQRAGADCGLSRGLSRFRRANFPLHAIGATARCHLARTGSRRNRRRSSRRFARRVGEWLAR